MPWQDIVSGILSTGGSVVTNWQNDRQAKRMMEFQERMSSTAAQRAARDYAAAGLNPALAYDRSASSPGGASAVMGDAINTGVTSARAARAAREQSQMNLAAQRLTAAQTEKAREEAMTAHESTELIRSQRESADQARNFQLLMQPYEMAQRRAESLLATYQLPGAKNTADFDELLGKAKPGMATAKTAAEIIKLILPRR